MEQQGFLVGKGRPVRKAAVFAAVFQSHFNSLLLLPRRSRGDGTLAKPLACTQGSADRRPAAPWRAKERIRRKKRRSFGALNKRAGKGNCCQGPYKNPKTTPATLRTARWPPAGIPDDQISASLSRSVPVGDGLRISGL
jgi:hypothetical protein